ncbi:SEC-C metal-binding domain-containing protein [Mannheimia indoligenes]|uniref:SEC-C metal-binding domain-containing protein n=1 Tax=Mannheimia indoligenes TaxID=3103145 RepID=UPI002FE62FA2
MNLLDNIRDENIIFKDLEKLCQQPGYAHVIAYFCYRDNTIQSTHDNVTREEMLGQYEPNRLLRTEISLLIGLMCKEQISLEIPIPPKFEELINKTEELLKELHLSITYADIAKLNSPEKLKSFLKSGKMLREVIFYGGESAYSFQYRDFSKIKYSYDNDWFVKNKGYSVDELHQVIIALEKIAPEKLINTIKSLQFKHPYLWTILDGYIFSIKEISTNTGINEEIVEEIIKSFSLSNDEDMSLFNGFGAFNPTNAYPIILLENGKFILFQHYSLTEAVYETPFFWFNKDKNYQNIAMEHRGKFTEDFSYERLKSVFGNNNVFKNIEIQDTNSNKLGEIDVLVTFANRAIILQAKAKKLTILARQGNDDALQDDFKKAIQLSYDQAVECGILLLDSKTRLILPTGSELKINRDFAEIYPLSIVSDHYPALATQARNFLNQADHNIIKPAFVIDIFALDVICEMLCTPLYFLSYIHRRAMYTDKFLANHELTILSYHLKENLYLQDNFTIMNLGDDLGVDLDLAMESRRNKLSNQHNVDGILTRYRGTFFEQLIKDLEITQNSKAIDLGLELLMLNEDTITVLNENFSIVHQRSLSDGKEHDLVLTFDKEDSSGLIIHCTNLPKTIALPKLEKHCEIRKYKHQSDRWFGIAIDIENTRLRFGVNKIYKWEQSDEMDKICGIFPFSKKVMFSSDISKPKNKIGRNDMCPCGSGKKYKKCCIDL